MARSFEVNCAQNNDGGGGGGGGGVESEANTSSSNNNNNNNENSSSGANDDAMFVDPVIANYDIHRFYTTRLKHSLIISFLLLIPVQNLFLFLITQFSEMVGFVGLLFVVDCLIIPNGLNRMVQSRTTSS